MDSSDDDMPLRNVLRFGGSHKSILNRSVTGSFKSQKRRPIGQIIPRPVKRQPISAPSPPPVEEKKKKKKKKRKVPKSKSKWEDDDSDDIEFQSEDGGDAIGSGSDAGSGSGSDSGDDGYESVSGSDAEISKDVEKPDKKQKPDYESKYPEKSKEKEKEEEKPKDKDKEAESDKEGEGLFNSRPVESAAEETAPKTPEKKPSLSDKEWLSTGGSPFSPESIRARQASSRAFLASMGRNVAAEQKKADSVLTKAAAHVPLPRSASPEPSARTPEVIAAKQAASEKSVADTKSKLAKAHADMVAAQQAVDDLEKEQSKISAGKHNQAERLGAVFGSAQRLGEQQSELDKQKAKVAKLEDTIDREQRNIGRRELDPSMETSTEAETDTEQTRRAAAGSKAPAPARQMLQQEHSMATDAEETDLEQERADRLARQPGDMMSAEVIRHADNTQSMQFLDGLIRDPEMGGEDFLHRKPATYSEYVREMNLVHARLAFMQDMEKAFAKRGYPNMKLSLSRLWDQRVHDAYSSYQKEYRRELKVAENEDRLRKEKEQEKEERRRERETRREKQKKAKFGSVIKSSDLELSGEDVSDSESEEQVHTRIRQQAEEEFDDEEKQDKNLRSDVVIIKADELAKLNSSEAIAEKSQYLVGKGKNNPATAVVLLERMHDELKKKAKQVKGDDYKNAWLSKWGLTIQDTGKMIRTKRSSSYISRRDALGNMIKKFGGTPSWEAKASSSSSSSKGGKK